MNRITSLLLLALLCYSAVSAQNVGIGTATPLSKLQVNGALGFNDVNTRVLEGNNNQVRIQTNSGYVDIGPANTSWVHFSTDRPNFFFDESITVRDGAYNAYATSDLFLQTNFTTRIFADNGTGNVGIGTIAPNEALEVNGNIRLENGGDAYLSNANGYIGFRPADTDHGLIIRDFDGSSTAWSGIRTQDDGAMELRADGASYEQLVLADNSFVGVGTAAPTQRLDINGGIRIRGGGPQAGYVLTATDVNGNATWSEPELITYDGTVVAGNWYRIASNTGNRAHASFTLRDFISGGGHSTLAFEAGSDYNNRANQSFTITSHSYYITPTFTNVRILTNTTYDDQYLEVYCARSGSVSFSIENNQQNAGWTPVSWTGGSVPGGYTASTYKSDVLLHVADNTSRLMVDQAGNVGLGTEAPAQQLDVNGRVRIRGGAPADGRVLTATNGSGDAQWEDLGDLFHVTNITTFNARGLSGTTPITYAYGGTRKPLFLYGTTLVDGSNNRSGGVQVRWLTSAGVQVRGWTNLTGANWIDGPDGGSGMRDMHSFTIPFYDGATQVQFRNASLAGSNNQNSIVSVYAVVEVGN